MHAHVSTLLFKGHIYVPAFLFFKSVFLWWFVTLRVNRHTGRCNGLWTSSQCLDQGAVLFTLLLTVFKALYSKCLKGWTKDHKHTHTHTTVGMGEGH